MDGTAVISEGTPITPKPSAWGKPTPWGAASVTPTKPCSLEDVMSEELAKELQQKEECELMKEAEGPGAVDEAAQIDVSAMMPGDTEVENDLLLAQMLQHEFDKEHDAILKREEKHLNSNSKVTVSFKNYRSVHPAIQDDEDSDVDIDDIYVDKHSTDVKTPTFNSRGVSGKGKTMVTKHDAVISGRKNATKAMDRFGPGLQIGDARSMDMQLSNKVYNKLKAHSSKLEKKVYREHEKKDHSTAEQAMDSKTRLILFKLVNGGTLDTVNGIISAGKEAVVYHADGGSMDGALVPSEVAVKIFKTTLADFKNRAIYVKGDVRFFKDEFKKQNPRRIMKIWAAKEEFNLRRMEKAGIQCPKAIILKKHILVMSFIGSGKRAAPKLKDAHLSTADVMDAYDQCISNLKRMVQVAGLVHADLSEYNMLWHDGILYFIDVGQAVEKMHPKAFEFLLRDCSNVCSFFEKKGVPDVPTPQELFNDITGLNFEGEGKDFLIKVEEYEKNEEKLREDKGKDYAFEFFFDNAKKERQSVKDLEAQIEDSESDEEEEEEEEGEEAVVEESPCAEDTPSQQDQSS